MESERIEKSWAGEKLLFWSRYQQWSDHFWKQAVVLKHQVISIHNADHIFNCIGPVSYRKITFIGNIRKWNYILKKQILCFLRVKRPLSQVGLFSMWLEPGCDARILSVASASWSVDCYTSLTLWCMRHVLQIDCVACFVICWSKCRLGYSSLALNSVEAVMHYELKWPVGISTVQATDSSLHSNACRWGCARRLWKSLVVVVDWGPLAEQVLLYQQILAKLA